MKNLLTILACVCSFVLAGSAKGRDLQAEIDSLAATGGGTLTLTSGVYRTGALFFKPGVNLHLEKGATILGVDEAEGYPMRETRIEGETCLYYPALINADGCDGFTITGEGVVDGHGLPTWKEFWTKRAAARKKGGDLKNKDLMRPRLLYVSNSKNVDISGVTFQNSKFWTTHYYRVQDLRIHDCEIKAEVIDGVRGPSTDAIDLDVCRGVVISNVIMNVNDDSVVIKGGKGPWADDYVKSPDQGPSSDILITDCTFRSVCHSCLTFGSESPEASNVTMRNCRLEGAGNLLYFKMRTDTPQHFSNVLVENVTGTCKQVFQVKGWSQYQNLKDRTTPLGSEVKDVLMRNCTIKAKKYKAIFPNPEHFRMENLRFENMNVNGKDQPDETLYPTEPKKTAAKVSRLFLRADPVNYQPPGYPRAKRYGKGEYIHYAVVSLWVNALECAHRAGDMELERELCARFDAYRHDPGVLNEERHVDMSIIGALPLEVARLRGTDREPELAKVGLSYAERQWSEPPEDARWGERIGYDPIPLAERRGWFAKGFSPETRLWIDDMYMITFLQSEAYRLTGERRYVDRAAKEMVEYLGRLQRPDGLFNHAPGAPYVWGRGAGWMAAAMTLNLKYLPKDSEWRTPIEAGYHKMMEALLRHQRRSGLWGQLVDDPGSWDETSGSAMFAYAFAEGVNNGWLDRAAYWPAAERAYGALVAQLDGEGNLKEVCVGTGWKNSRTHYLTRPRCIGDPHGQAPLLWLCNALMSAE